jgi:hypothetical protein
MSTSHSASKMILGASFVVFAFASSASADPGRGLRWSDFAWGSSNRSGSTMRSVPSTSNAVPAAPIASATAPAGTIAIRGADGVVRNYAMENGVLVERTTGLPGTAAAQTQTPAQSSSTTPGAAPAVVQPMYYYVAPSRGGLFRRCR